MPLKESTARLDEEVGRFVNGRMTDNAAVLAAIFGMNNEIGKLLRPTGDPSIRSLQLLVNEVTKAAKRKDRKRLAEAMERVRREALNLT